MKKIAFPITLLLMLVLVFAAGCKSEPGFGGQGTINATVKHHDEVIPHARVFVKFGVAEFPGTDSTVYDYKISASGQGLATITGLSKGDYYLYAIGYDATIQDSVFGGIPVSLGNDEDIQYKTLAVTE